MEAQQGKTVPLRQVYAVGQFLDPSAAVSLPLREGEVLEGLHTVPLVVTSQQCPGQVTEQSVIHAPKSFQGYGMDGT